MADKIISFQNGAWSSGTYTWWGNAYTTEVYYTLSSQNIQGNYSNVKVEMKFSGMTSGYRFNWYGINGTWAALYVNGSRVGYKELGSFNGDATTLFSWSGIIPHNDDGTKTFTIKAILHGPNTGRYDDNRFLPHGEVSDSKDIALPVIPRKSSLTLSPVTLQDPSVNLTVNVTKAAPGFVDTVEWCVRPQGGSPSDWVVLAEKSSTSGFIIPYSTILTKLGNVSGEIQVRITTYSDSSSITPLGSMTKSAILKQGGIPLSLYQNGTSVGASLIGEEITQPGLFIADEGPFEVRELTIGGVTYKVLAKVV